VTINNLKNNQELVLENLPNLIEIDCADNQLVSLNIFNCPQLEKIDCSDNLLTDLNISSCFSLNELLCDGNLLTNLTLPASPSSLEKLDLSDNNFSFTQDLSFLTSATNLEELHLGNCDEDKVSQGIYNRFSGSLEPLKNLTNLQKLDISNTDINSGWEYLPTSVKTIYFSSETRPNSKVKEISERLE
jgi:Leucine-rich repeat (LRR) protein